MTTLPITIEQTLTEEETGVLMKQLAWDEGHRPRTPRSDMKHHVPPPSRIKEDIIAFFKKHTGPISTQKLQQEIDGVQVPNLRRVCRDLDKEGFIRTERTNTGCLYTFAGSPD